MEYLGFWVTRNGVRPVKKSGSHGKYESTQNSKTGACVNRLSKILQVYVVQTVTFIVSFNCA